MRRLGAVIAAASLAACAARHPLKVDCERHLVRINRPAAHVSGALPATGGSLPMATPQALVNKFDHPRARQLAQRSGRGAARDRAP